MTRRNEAGRAHRRLSVAAIGLIVAIGTAPVAAQMREPSRSNPDCRPGQGPLPAHCRPHPEATHSAKPAPAAAPPPTPQGGYGSAAPAAEPNIVKPR